MQPNQSSRNTPVYTVVGRYLGRVVEVELDKASSTVSCYHVAVPFWLGGLWRKRLLIAPSQVVSVTPKRMVVEEPIVRVPAGAPGIVPEVS